MSPFTEYDDLVLRALQKLYDIIPGSYISAAEIQREVKRSFDTNLSTRTICDSIGRLRFTDVTVNGTRRYAVAAGVLEIKIFGGRIITLYNLYAPPTTSAQKEEPDNAT